MRVSIRVGGFTLLLSLLLLAPSGTASADGIKFGVRGGFYTDVDDAFAGVELLTRVAHRFYFNPNVEYVFIESGHYVTLNGDFHYDLLPGDTYVWIGAGLGVAILDPEGPDNSTTDAVGNLFVGLGFHTGGGVIPYVQAKVIVKDDTAASLAVGLRF